MVPELGHFALIVALCLSGAQALLALSGARTANPTLLATVRPLTVGVFVFVAFAFGALGWSFVQNDFSVLYVAQNSNSALPTLYRIAAIWGAHEGSLLLWILIQSTWTLAVAVNSRHLAKAFAARVLGVLGLVNVGFMLFTLTTSNPFARLLPPALDGRDLNPLLQDPALAIHPPMLYVGYVGFSVAFAFAIAAMLEGKLDAAWARWTRRWTTLSWLFLTVGITLGSWWAYYELGWGGWWFWDPVENASFMPWLVGTALIHSLAVTEKRGLFKSWTLLLAIFAFSLSLLGTFLVRSGVLVSVHAFASDPARGLFILGFLVAVIGSALTLYALRAPKLVSGRGFQPFSRETFLLLNNVLLVVAAAAILVGTLWPLFLDALNLPKVSVGPPYFDVVFLLPMLPLALLVSMGMHVRWSRPRRPDMTLLQEFMEECRRLLWRLRIPAIVALVLGLLITLGVYGGAGVLTVLGMVTGLWVIAAALLDPISRVWKQRRLRVMPRAMLGMSLAHLGVGVFIIGVTVTNSFGIERDISMRPGDTASLMDYRFTFAGLEEVEGPNYEAVQGRVTVYRGEREVATLTPQKRVYRVQTNPMTEAAIDPALRRDLFVALGEPLGDGAWSVRLQYKPLIRLIWLGALLMALGGLVAALDVRYRVSAAEARRAVQSASGEPLAEHG